MNPIAFIDLPFSNLFTNLKRFTSKAKIFGGLCTGHANSNSFDNQRNDATQLCSEWNGRLGNIDRNLKTLIASHPLGPAGIKMSEHKLKFKKSSFAGKKRTWKSLKQILAIEKTLPWSEDAITYSSLNPPPSFLPAKKYSDISGLLAPYTDPQTKLRYHNSEEYAVIKNLPSDIVAGYLALRGAASIV